MGQFADVMTADIAVVENMKEFSAYTISSKFPNTVDGLKQIHRRIILTLHDNPNTAKEATIAGRVMEIHPHGDASIAAAISGLAQPFTNIVPLVDSNSNLGTYVGEGPAAARYVEVREAALANDLFFKNTDLSTLKYVLGEAMKTEPANFVPVVPSALFFPVLGIACGFKTETSAISLANACVVARKFVEMKYSDPDFYRKKVNSLCKYLLPDFPSYCHLRNSEQIVREYKKSNFSCPFVLDGIMKVTKDSITVVTLPPDRSFGKVTQDVGTSIVRDAKSWLHEHFMDGKDLAGDKEGSLKGSFYCPLRRGENPFEVLTMFKKQIQFTSIWKPTMLFNDDEHGMSQENQLTLLDKWSDARYKVVLGGLKQKLIKLQDRYRLLMALVIVVDHAKEVCDIFNSSKDEEATVSILVKRFGLTAFQARQLQGLQLRKLTAKGKQELLDEIEEIKQKNLELQKKFTKVDQEIIANITEFENKYAAEYPAKCTVPKYIGTACYKKTGWILFEDLKECDTILNDFGSEDITFSLFQQNNGMIVVVGSDDPDRNPDVDPPKYIHASSVEMLDGPNKLLAAKLGDGAAFVPMPKVTGLIANDLIPVIDSCTMITKEGRKIVQVTDKLTRSSLNVQTPAIKDVYGMSPITDEDVIVVQCNTKIPGVITIDRVTGDKKVYWSPVGKNITLAVVRIGCPCMFSIPQEVSVRTPVKHMYIQDLSKYVAPNSSMKLLLTKKQTSDGQALAPRSNRSAIYTIKD